MYSITKIVYAQYKISVYISFIVKFGVGPVGNIHVLIAM